MGAALARVPAAAILAGSLAAAALDLGVGAPLAAQDPARARPALEPYRDTIPGTLVTFEMIPLAAGTVEVPGPGGPRQVRVDPIWIARTETTWDMYDVFALGLDSPAGDPPADAVARPSNPYGAPDYGWGHAGYPVMSVTRSAAAAFCEWLSAKTGRRYRLPTEAEWLHAARLGLGLAPEPPRGAARVPPDTTVSGRTASGSGARQARLDAMAWHAGNADGTTHAVAGKQPDALGLHDLLGNVAEWVDAVEGERVARGGSYRDGPGVIGTVPRAVQDASWNERDPQLPKSRWWLSDAPFIGFRIVRDP